MTRGLDGDIIVFLEIDARVLLRRIIGCAEKLTLNAGVRGTGDMFAVTPLAVARASSVAAATRSGSAAICVAVEVTVVVPATAAAVLALWLGLRREIRSMSGSRTPAFGTGTSIVGIVTKLSG